MNFRITSAKVGLLVLCCVIFLIGLSVSTQRKKTPTTMTLDAHSSIQFAHAAGSEGCSKCHSTPIAGSCTGCHPSPPTTFNSGVLFPHHDREAGGPIDSCSDSSCHDAGSDARFVDTPNASHSYCNDCHSNDMSHR